MANSEDPNDLELNTVSKRILKSYVPSAPIRA